MQATDITKDTLVGELAATLPQTTRVFQRHGIDFCCGGGVPLSQACETSGVALDTVLGELTEEIQAEGCAVESWAGAPLDDLIEHILTAYHRPLDEELPRIEAMARKVYDVHGDKDPERLGQLVSTFVALKTELEQHMMKEEQILFPMIKQGGGAMAGGPVHVMRLEHDDAGDALKKLSSLTDGYTPPEGACTTWRALYHALGDLERSLMEHIHLENNILFPRALST